MYNTAIDWSRYSGCGIDEWNTRNATVEQMAATGYRAAKKRWPGLFIAAWVTGLSHNPHLLPASSLYGRFLT